MTSPCIKAKLSSSAAPCCAVAAIKPSKTWPIKSVLILVSSSPKLTIDTDCRTYRAKRKHEQIGAGGGIRTPEGARPFDLQSNAFDRFATPAFVEPPDGFEPTTFTLQKCCSTS